MSILSAQITHLDTQNPCQDRRLLLKEIARESIRTGIQVSGNNTVLRNRLKKRLHDINAPRNCRVNSLILPRALSRARSFNYQSDHRTQPCLRRKKRMTYRYSDFDLNRISSSARHARLDLRVC